LPISNPHICHADRESQIKLHGNPESERSQPALSWLIPQYQGFCSYANIAQTTGSTLQYLFVTPDQAIKSTHDGFQSGYHIDPEAFEAALRITVGDDDQSPV
jgi:hypothetical protein